MNVVRSGNYGRRGCGRLVANGMQCCACEFWFHENCTGLSESQYASLSLSNSEFRCMACITNSTASAPPTSNTDIPVLQTPIEPLTDSSTGNNNDVASPSQLQSQLNGLSSILHSILEHVERNGRSVTDMSDGIAALTYRILRLEELCSTLPLARASKEAEKMSQHMIEEAASANADAAARAKNILVRGLQFSLNDPVQTATTLLSPVLAVFPHIKVATASWFFRKDQTAARPLLITFATGAQRTAVLQAKHLITNCFQGVFIHPDRPISKRPIKKAPLPNAVHVSVVPTVPSTDNHLPSASSSNYQSPMQTPTSTPIKPRSLRANSSMPTHIASSPVGFQIRRAESFPCLCPISEPRVTSTQVVRLEPKTNVKLPIPACKTTSAVPKNGGHQKHNGRPPSKRMSFNRRTSSAAVRPVPLMSIKTRPPCISTNYPFLRETPYYPAFTHHPQDPHLPNPMLLRFNPFLSPLGVPHHQTFQSPYPLHYPIIPPPFLPCHTTLQRSPTRRR
jgi:hypothetical protein